MQFVQARNYYRGRRKAVRLIVIHTMETPQKPGTALAVAGWFAGPDAPQASAHYCIDDAAVVWCVREGDTAWHAPGVNADGIGLEHSGSAALRRAGWVDRYSQMVLTNSAKLAADIAARHNIPLVHLTNEQLAAGAKGFIGHAQASQVYGGDHTDPGDEFPWAAYLKLVQAAAAAKAKRPWTKREAAIAAAALLLPAGWFGGITLAGTPAAKPPVPRTTVTVTVTAAPHPTPLPTRRTVPAHTTTGAVRLPHTVAAKATKTH